MTRRSVDSPHCHIWTDALHGRRLAREAKDDWNRGTYVRWTVASAWTAFEATCEHLTGVSGLGMRFKEHLDEALINKGLAKPDWGAGLWQRVLRVDDMRKRYIHPAVPQEALFPPASEADEAIMTLRAAIRDMYARCRAGAANWAEDDEDVILPTGGFFAMAHATVIHAGASAETGLRISYQTIDGKEHDAAVTGPDEDHVSLMNDLLGRLRAPATAVRAYWANELIEEWDDITMRGGPQPRAL